MLTTCFFSDILQNAPFRSHIFKIFFASGGKGALTPSNQNPADVPECDENAPAGKHVFETPGAVNETCLSLCVVDGRV